MVSPRVLVDEIYERLSDRKQTFSLAESCTAGLLSAAFAYKDGLSSVYQGSVVSYSNLAKEKVLNVSPSALEDCGAVSEVVAIAMATGVKDKLESHWALSVTGVAGPSGGSVDKPVGHVCFAVSGPNYERAFTQRFSGDRAQVQGQAIDFILRQFLQTLKS